jgi:hypothetical protein
MPEIKFSTEELKALKRIVRNSDSDIPDDIPTTEEWVDEQAEQVDDPNRGLLAEAAPSEIAEPAVLAKIDQLCPVCGSTECDEDIAYVGPNPIHASEHPEQKAARGRDRRAERLSAAGRGR